MTTTLKAVPIILRAVTIGLCATALLYPAAATAKPRADEDGRSHCIIEGSGDWGEVTFNDSDHSCCFWEDMDDGEALRVCLECDENWKNCEEVIASGRPNVSTGIGSRTKAPQTGGPGPATNMPGKNLNLEFKLGQ